MKICLLAGLMLAIGDHESDQAQAPQYRVELRRMDDRAKLIEAEDYLTLEVVSRTGIGSARLIAKDKAFLPNQVRLRLRSAGGNSFDTLEGLKLTTSRWQVRGGSRQSGKLPFFLPDRQGKFEPDDTQPAGWLDIKITAADKALELQFPARLLIQEQTLDFEWIDFYRN